MDHHFYSSNYLQGSKVSNNHLSRRISKYWYYDTNFLVSIIRDVLITGIVSSAAKILLETLLYNLYNHIQIQKLFSTITIKREKRGTIV